MSQFHSLRISDITRETSQAVSLTFDVPKDLKEQYAFIAGQYITIKATINGEEVRRDYSICTSANSGVLKVTIKAVENGLFSNYANTTLHIGDTLEVSLPKGRFTYIPSSGNKTIVAFAAGSGITPVMSIVKTVLETQTDSKVILMYGNKTVNNTIFFNELLELQKTFIDRLYIHFLFSQSQEEEGLFGRIEKSTVNLVLKNKHKAVTPDAYYICGPEGMILTVKEVLLEHDIDDSKILYELFKVAKTTQAETTTAVASGQCDITVIVDDETTTFTMDTKQTVLEAALAKDLDAPYSCQGGICSSCIARVTDGEAKMIQNNILTDNEVAEGLILTCQAQPITSNITVDYDEV